MAGRLVRLLLERLISSAAITVSSASGSKKASVSAQSNSRLDPLG
jgi:hypothetical protein